MRRAPFLLLLALGAGALLYDLTTALRLPSLQDWAEASAAVRLEPGEAVQVWPWWADRARRWLPSVLAEEDPLHADYVGVERLWVIGFRPLDLSPRGATRLGEARAFGKLTVSRWDLHAPPVAAQLTQGDFHEVDSVARRCQRVPVGARFAARGAGAELHVRAGVIGERAYDAEMPDVTVVVSDGAALLGTLLVPRTARDGTGWRRLDLPLAGAGERDFLFDVRSPDGSRPFCLQAWTTR